MTELIPRFYVGNESLVGGGGVFFFPQKFHNPFILLGGQGRGGENLSK